MTYVASLAVPFDKSLLEVLITATEDSITGVREALITHELMLAAGASEKEQLRRNVFPIEWKFERYHPGTRGDLSYLLSDDEKYDASFPHHPLTRVRRWLRHIERTFRVGMVEELSPEPNAVPGSWEAVGGIAPNRCEIAIVQPKPMGYEEAVREFGPQVAHDAVMEEAFKKLNRDMNQTIAFPPIETRQKNFRELRDAELRKVVDDFQARQKKLQSVGDAATKVLYESRAEEITVLLARARDTGSWLTVREGSACALAIFQNAAFYDDFTETRGRACEPERITIKELFALLHELAGEGVDSLTLDRCPRCHDARPVISLAEIACEADLLRLYATGVAGKRVLSQEKLDAALLETDPAKRLSALRLIIEHFDPAHPDACVEMAKLAVAGRDGALFEQCHAKLSRYQPERLSSLPAFPAS